jgi:hypothetical protein
MLLEEDASDEAFVRNLREMFAAGHTREEALDAAYAIRCRHGGTDDREAMEKAASVPRPSGAAR